MRFLKANTAANYERIFNAADHFYLLTRNISETERTLDGNPWGHPDIYLNVSNIVTLSLSRVILHCPIAW